MDEVAPFGRRACFFYYFCFFFFLFVVYPLFCFLPSLSIYTRPFLVLFSSSSYLVRITTAFPLRPPPPSPPRPFFPSARSYFKILQDRRAVPLVFSFPDSRSNETSSCARERPFPLRDERQYVSHLNTYVQLDSRRCVTSPLVLSSFSPSFAFFPSLALNNRNARPAVARVT